MHRLNPDLPLSIEALEELLRDQLAAGDADGAALTRRTLAKVLERQRLRHQAIRAGRWPFHVDDGQKQGDADD